MFLFMIRVLSLPSGTFCWAILHWDQGAGGSGCKALRAVVYPAFWGQLFPEGCGEAHSNHSNVTAPEGARRTENRPHISVPPPSAACPTQVGGRTLPWGSQRPRKTVQAITPEWGENAQNLSWPFKLQEVTLYFLLLSLPTASHKAI